jgi:hypothetical protein
MKRELGWFQIGSGLVLSLLFLIVLPACKPLIEVKVDAQCGPKGDKEDPPTGPGASPCRWEGNTCTHKPDGCVCRK